MKKRSFIVTELVDCPVCKDGTCGVCEFGKVTKEVSLAEALKCFMVDVPNTGYFGIIVEKK